MTDMRKYIDILNESVEQIDEISDFKRREIEWELRHEERDARRETETHYMAINGKVWKKNGNPVSFKNKRHGLNVMSKIAKNKPDAVFHVLHHSLVDFDGVPKTKLVADGKVIFDPKAGK